MEEEEKGCLETQEGDSWHSELRQVKFACHNHYAHLRLRLTVTCWHRCPWHIVGWEEGRRAVHSKKGLFCVRSAVGRHPHFNALLYTCQRESMSSACLPWMPAKPNRNPFNFQIVECLHTHTPRDTNTYTHVRGIVLLWVHFPIPLSLCVTRPHAHTKTLAHTLVLPKLNSTFASCLCRI